MSNMYSEAEVRDLIDASLYAGANLMPYVNKDLTGCLFVIKNCLPALKRYDIKPEIYWHGDAKEYECFLMLLSGGYPNKDVLLEIAKEPTVGVFQRIYSHYNQTIEVMFNYHDVYKGYDVLKPSEFMLYFHPDARGKLYVYPREYWSHRDNMSMDRPFLIIREDEINMLPALMKKRCGIIE